ncbi:MAG: hypothetical protein ABIY55_30975, partial [Kofleriaceae bacterium]
MSSSTNPIGFALESVPDHELASMLNVSRGEIAARRKKLVAQLTDPAWIAKTLDALPAATLAVLHLVCDGGGIVLEDHLFREGRVRFGLSEDDCRAAAIPAVERLLAIPLTTPHGDVALGVLRPAAPLIAPLVAGLDLLELPPATFVPDEHPVRNARTFLAVCIATRHVDIKVTNEGRPHRSATKRLAKQVGLDEVVVEELLLHAMSSGLIVIEGEGELLRPDLVALAAAANGRYPYCASVAAAQDRLGLGPLPIHGLLHSLLRRREVDVTGFIGLDAFDCLPGFVTGTVNGTRAVMLRVIEGGVAGHVTPSFEVMLPPESRLLDIVQVGACCDWERLDRAIVGRISKASVMRAVAGRASAADIVAQLRAASRHPIPQNVEAAIHDWAGAVIAATIASGHVVVVEPAARDRVAPGLLGLGGRELAPGVFLVERDDARRQIEAVLARAGARHRAPAVARPAPRTEPAALPASPAAARVRARVRAWQRREDFEGKRDDFLELSRKIADAEAGALRLVEQQLAGWERTCGDALQHDDPAYHALIAILASLPMDTRTNLLASSHDVSELLRALSRIAPGRGLISVPRSLASALSVPIAPRMPRSSRQPPRPPPLMWQEERLRERLERAAEDVEAMALQLPNGVRYVEVDRVIRRGTTWMVLGNDVRSGDSVAVRLDDVEAIAAMPDDLEAYDLSLPGDAEASDDGDAGDARDARD